MPCDICLSLWLPLLSEVITLSIHAAVNGVILFWFMAEQCSTVEVHHSILIFLSMDFWVEFVAVKRKKGGMSFFFRFPENKDDKENSEQSWKFLVF